MTVFDTIAHTLDELKSASENIIITAHQKPDGDAMGSSLALYNYLKAAGIASQVIMPTDYAAFLKWLPGDEEVLIYTEEKTKCDSLLSKAKYIFCLDFNAIGRVYEMADSIKNSGAKVVMIDHHRDPQDFDDERFLEIGVSSTCELIYKYISKHLDASLLDKVAGECIYTGLITDTGSFRFGSTTSDTLRTASDLMSLGVVPDEIYRSLFDQNRLERLQLLGYYLSNRVDVIENGSVALGYLSTEELERYNVITGDTEGFVNYGLGIKGVQLSALIIDRGSLVKMSFRSADKFPCNEFSSEFFNGGGHKNAAGGASTQSLEETISKFKSSIKTYKEFL